ncbi:MAG TPA: hypothetical protein PKG60_04630 [Spirochaetota bacterium]|nr:hypothetical protein [Spirochaetota bacterium]
MKLILIFSFLTIFLPHIISAGPLINEISAGGSSDWVELTLSGDTPSCDISQYFVTMYYGTNEKIADSAVTLRNRNIPETPYDDRFAVVHFTSVPYDDETDATGDTNGNGVFDLYCCNYGLWNTDCVVSIDSDDIHTNGGILDFAAFSNRDGSMNSTIEGYINTAASAGEWTICGSANIQECTVDIGKDGLNSYSTISRINKGDTNSPDDFAVTPYSTPGRENIINTDKGKRKLFRTESKESTHSYGRGPIRLAVFLYESCSIKLRIFNSTGFTVYSSDLKEDLSPGYYTFYIPEAKLRGKILTGLYPVKIEAAGKSSRSETATIFLVIVRKR